MPSKLRKDSNRSRSHRISEVSAEPLSASLEGRSASNAQTWNGAGTLQLDQQAWKPRIVQDPVFQHALVYKSSWPGPMDAHGCPRMPTGKHRRGAAPRCPSKDPRQLKDSLAMMGKGLEGWRRAPKGLRALKSWCFPAKHPGGWFMRIQGSVSSEHPQIAICQNHIW